MYVLRRDASIDHMKPETGREGSLQHFIGRIGLVNFENSQRFMGEQV